MSWVKSIQVVVGPLSFFLGDDDAAFYNSINKLTANNHFFYQVVSSSENQADSN